MPLLPILKWKSYFEGSTGYIDQINPKNVAYPIMIGIDDYKRPYITIKTQTLSRRIFIQLLLLYSKDIQIQNHHGHMVLMEIVL